MSQYEIKPTKNASHAPLAYEKNIAAKTIILKPMIKNLYFLSNW